MNHLKEILLTLANDKVDFIIGGGVAAVLHGVERMTLDLDISVSMTPQNLQRFYACMKDLHLKPKVPISPETLVNPEELKRLLEQKHALVLSFMDYNAPYRVVDMFIKDHLAYEVLLPHTVELIIDQTPVRVISARKLLEIKKAIQPPRDKDAQDIRDLEQMLGRTT